MGFASSQRRGGGENMWGKQHGDTKVSGGGEEVLQAPEPRFLYRLRWWSWWSSCPPAAHGDPQGMQRSTCSPWEDTHVRAGGCLEEAVIQWETQWREGVPASRLEQPVLGGLHPVEREIRFAAVLGGLTVRGRDSGLQQVWLGCCSWEWTQAGEVNRELSPVAGTPQSHRGRTPSMEQWKKISVMNWPCPFSLHCWWEGGRGWGEMVFYRLILLFIILLWFC